MLARQVYSLLIQRHRPIRSLLGYTKAFGTSSQQSSAINENHLLQAPLSGQDIKVNATVGEGHHNTFLSCSPAKSRTMTVPIPAPPSVPFLGNINALDKELPLRSYNLLASQYGEIYQLQIAGMSVA